MTGVNAATRWSPYRSIYWELFPGDFIGKIPEERLTSIIPKKSDDSASQ